MEWCCECGELLDDREWKVPHPPEVEDRLDKLEGKK